MVMPVSNQVFYPAPVMYAPNAMNAAPANIIKQEAPQEIFKTIANAGYNTSKGTLILNSRVANTFDTDVFREIYPDGSALVRSAWNSNGTYYPPKTFSAVVQMANEIYSAKANGAKGYSFEDEDSLKLLEMFNLNEAAKMAIA